MGQVIQTNGDYNIKTRVGANINLDTGPGVGNVRVTGNLVVEGETVTVSAEQLRVVDNIITLNDGELGAGVSLRFSGIEIDRGQLPDAFFVWDEQLDSWLLATGTINNLSYQDSKLLLKEIKTFADEDSGDLTLIGTGTGVVKVKGTLNYELQVTDDDDIPNKKYVDTAIIDNPSFQVRSDDSRVYIADKDIPGALTLFTNTTGFNTFGESAISMIVDGQLVTQFYSDKVFLQDLEINNNQITTSDTNGNVFVRTQGTGKLQTNYAIQYDHISSPPAFVSNSSLIFGADPKLGTTGIWFVNDSQDTANNNGSRYRTGELISKNKALVFSMIF
jgi:hypothetical protein